MDPIVKVAEVGDDSSVAEGVITEDVNGVDNQVDDTLEGGDKPVEEFSLDDHTSDQPSKPIVKVKAAPADKEEPGEEDNEDVEETPEEKDKEDDDSESDEELDKEEETTTAEDKEVAGTNKDKRRRDYSGFSEDEVKALKKLQNPQFNLFAPKLRAARAEAESVKAKLVEAEKQLTGKGIPQSWYEHPQAFMLDGEYSQLSRQINYADREAAFYQKQLVNIKSGEEWRYITGYDKEGNPIISNPQTPSNEAEVQISSGLAEIQQQKQSLRGQLGSLQRDFKGRYEQTANAIKQTVDQYVDRMDEQFRPKPEIEKLMEDALGPMHRNNPLTHGYKKLFGIAVELAKEINRQRGAKVKDAKIKNDKAKAGPKVTNLPKGGESRFTTTPRGGKIEKEVDISELMGD